MALAQPVILHLPPRMGGDTMTSFAQSFINACADGMPSDVYIDFARLNFIEPAGITFLSNFCSWMTTRGIKPFFINHDGRSPSLRYLDDSLFFEQHIGSKVDASATPRPTTRHLQRVEHERSHSWLRFNFVPWLVEQTEKTPASFYPLQVCVSEVFNNIQDHSEQANGSLFIQRFPNKNTISISIADFGVGIPDRVRTVMPHLGDCDAILAAVKLGFTTKTTPRNRGAGLDYLLQTVCATNGGYVRIYSAGGYALFQGLDGEVVHQTSDSVGFCPGTTIEILIRTDAIADVDEASEDLTW